MLTTASRHSQSIRFILFASALGMVIVCLFATVQFRLVLHQLPSSRFYMIPLLVGAIFGSSMGWVYLKLKQREQEQRENAAALRQSEARQRALLAAFPDAIARINRAGVYLEIKEPSNFSSVLPIAQMLGKKHSEVLPAEMTQQFEVNIAQALATEKLQAFEYTAMINGEPCWREARIVPVNPNEVIAILRDISERKRSEVSLRQSEARLRALLEVIPDAIMRVRQDGVYLDVKPPNNFTASTDFTQLVGKTMQEVSPPQLAHRGMYFMRQALTTGQTQSYEIELEVEGQRQFREIRVVPSGADEVIIIARDFTALKQAKGELELAVTGERHRIARELHDSVTQTLFSASMIADVLPILWEKKPEAARSKLAELRQSTRGALAEMRTLLLELRPEALIDADFKQLLHQLAEAITGRSRMPITYQIEGEYAQLPAEIRIAFYRTTQEALNNIVKHAAATAASVVFYCQTEQVELTVQDNGLGFDMHCVAGGHLGLSNMRERMTAIGGDLSIHSAPGQGTTVKAVWHPPP